MVFKTGGESAVGNVSEIESVTIFRIIKSIDNEALITQANVNGVYGKGFDELKLKMKAPAAPHTPAAGKEGA